MDRILDFAERLREELIKKAKQNKVSGNYRRAMNDAQWILKDLLIREFGIESKEVKQ